MAVPPLASKQHLRAAARRQRRACRAALAAAGGLAAAERQLVELLMGAARDRAVVAVHLPYGDEPALDGLAPRLAGAGRRLALPVVDWTGTARFAAWSPGEPLDPGPFGIGQPMADAAEIEPDLIIAPLLAFDRAGRRLGQGGGHYDRLFARHRFARRLGCAWSGQEVAHVPEDAWDMPLHAIATERGLVDCGARP